MGASNPKAERGTGWLTFLIALVPPVGYLLIWSLLKGSDGCGPPGHSTAGHILTASVFVLPVAAAGTVVAFGAARSWRRGTLAWAAASVLVIGGMLEFFAFMVEFGAHHCGE